MFSPPADCGTVSSGQIPANMWQVSGDQLTSQANLSVQYFWPELQLADGSYVGTEGASEGETLGNPVTSQSSASVADINSSGVLWQQSFGAPVLPLYATDDGSVTVTSTQYTQEGTTLPGVQGQLGTLYALDQNGNVTSQNADVGDLYSWKGTYTRQTDPSIQSVATLIPDLSATYAAVIGGNLTGNGFALVHHTFGIVFCNTIQGVGDGSCPSNITDMSFIYSPGVLQENQTGCDFSVASACNGYLAHPEWVAAVKNNALNAYVAAFSQLPVIVNRGEKPQMLYGGPSSTTNFDHTIYIDGSWSTNGGGECPGPGLTTAPKWSWVFYLNDECNAEVNLGPYNANNPDFTPPLSDSTNMLKLAAAIGRTIGNTAAHETAWQIQNSGTVLPGMECGPGSENQYEPNGKACENGINSVYEAASSGEWDSIPNYLPAISWEPTDMKILDKYFSNIH